MAFLAVALPVAILAVCAGLLGVHRRVRQLEDRPRTAASPAYNDAELRTLIGQLQTFGGELDARIDDLYLAVDEGIKHVDRSERRVRAVVGRAKARMADLGYEDPALEGEAEQLRLVDGGAGEDEGLRPVHEYVEDHQQGDPYAGFPGDFSGFEMTG